MTHRLPDKVAVITGAASGIGRATVQRFVKEGAQVVATDISAQALDMLSAELSQHGRTIRTICGDVTKRVDAEKIAQYALESGGKLDILINSAGITPRTLPSEADFEERWDAVMAVNAKGTMLMCHAAVEVMRDAGSGAIVNLASVAGLVGYPISLPFSDGFAPYTHSKGAVIQLTRDMGVRLAAAGIRVNAVCPGFIYTPLTANVTQDPEIHKTICELHPLGRMGYPEEVVNVITFLASDEASFVAAAAWTVDGGYTAM